MQSMDDSAETVYNDPRSKNRPNKDTHAAENETKMYICDVLREEVR